MVNWGRGGKRRGVQPLESTLTPPSPHFQSLTPSNYLHLNVRGGLAYVTGVEVRAISVKTK